MMCVPLSSALLLLLSVGLSESCSCGPGHPQEFYCMSNIVMRAEVTGEKIIPNSTYNSYTEGMGEIQYEIKVIEVFKGSDRIKEIQHVYTSEMSSMCGVRLDHGQYLFSSGNTNLMLKRFYITMCDFVRPWDSLSLIQKNNFKYTYNLGCDCKISSCTEEPCLPNRRNECTMIRWSSSRSEFACIRQSDGSCDWYRGTAKPSANDTMEASSDV